jgi:hypothetical protein
MDMLFSLQTAMAYEAIASSCAGLRMNSALQIDRFWSAGSPASCRAIDR